jgi:hypothetical protein
VTIDASRPARDTAPASGPIRVCSTPSARVGIDFTGAQSKPVGMFLGRRFDDVITLCEISGRIRRFPFAVTEVGP